MWGGGRQKKEEEKENRVKHGNTEKSPKSRLNHDLFYSSSVKLMNFCVYSPKVILKSSPRIKKLQVTVVETILTGLFHILKNVPLGLSECVQRIQLLIVP